MSYLTNSYRYVVGGCENFPQSLTTSANGTNDGSVIDTSGQKLGSGCLSFDGVDDTVNCDGAIDFSTTIGTIAFWYNVNIAETAQPTLLSFTVETAQEMLNITFDTSLGTESQGYLQCTSYLASAGGMRWEVNSPIQDKAEWQWVCLVQDGTAVKAYFNNVEQETFVTENDKSTWITGSMDTTRIGCILKNNVPARGFYQGLIDDVVLFNTAIDSTTRDFLYNSGTGRKASQLESCDGIRVYYNCDEFDGSTLTNNAVPT